MTAKNIFPNGIMGGTHRGPNDWYQDVEGAIRSAIEHESKPWTTGWMGCKHEILSTKISWDGRQYILEASVSDDFDTSGIGRVKIDDPIPDAGVISGTPKDQTTTDVVIEAMAIALKLAHQLADDDRRANRMYAGYSIHTIENGKPTSWIETYIKNTHGLDAPPGGCYHEWGFQGEDSGELTEEERQAIASVVDEWWSHDPEETGQVRVGKFIVKAW